MGQVWEHSWTAGSVVAVVLWVGGIVAVVADLFIPEADDVGHVGLLLAFGGKLLYDHGVAQKMREREQRAFELGREVSASVTQIQR